MIVFKKKKPIVLEMANSSPSNPSTTSSSSTLSSLVQTLVAQALELPSAKIDPSKWSLDVVLQVAVEVAGLVKNASPSLQTKQQLFDLLLQVVNALLDQLQAKELNSIASLPQDSSTVSDAVVQRWVNLKAVVNTTLPVVFSYTSHLSLPPAVANCFSCFAANVVAIEEKVVAALPVVESVVASALPVIDEVAVASGNTAVVAVVEKVEADLPKVVSVAESVSSAPLPQSS